MTPHDWPQAVRNLLHRADNVRRSTWILTAFFLAVLVLYFVIRPAPEQQPGQSVEHRPATTAHSTPATPPSTEHRTARPTTTPAPSAPSGPATQPSAPASASSVPTSSGEPSTRPVPTGSAPGTGATSP